MVDTFPYVLYFILSLLTWTKFGVGGEAATELE
jgi:hypothetical protein